MAKPGHRTTANSQRLLEKYFYFFSSLLVAAVVVCGFHRTIEEKLVHAAPPRPFLLYVHGVPSVRARSDPQGIVAQADRLVWRWAGRGDARRRRLHGDHHGSIQQSSAPRKAP